jgi:LacI family transcriptional regulator
VQLNRFSIIIKVVVHGWKKPTISDVARLAGVSVATVSAVCNGTKVVSPRRAQMVREAMETLDYHADQNARSLRTGKTKVVGVIIPDLTNPFYTQVITAAEEVASRAGYSFFLCNSNDDPAQEQRHLDMLFSHRVAAVLIAPSDSSVAYDRLIRRRFPLVFFDRIPPGFHGSSVETDNRLAAYLATRHLIELGHRSIAILAGDIQRSTHARRLDGFRRAMQEAELPTRDEYCGLSGLTVQAAYQFSLGLLQAPQAPTAIFCTSNNLLLGCFRALECAGLRCPDNVSVIAFDDFPWNEGFRPAITTVAQPTAAIGSKAMEMLLERIAARSEGGEMSDQNIVLQPELRIRNSTAPPSPATRAAVAVVPETGSDAKL